MADPVFFDRVRARAAAAGITLRNLSTRLDDCRFDLTVGLRQSPDPVVKQANSVTHYLRDARELAAGEFDARRQWLQAREVRKGFLPLSVGYTDDPDFWDKRRATLADLTARTGFDLGTMDVLELEDGQLLVLDYNERTAESAWPDLEAIWDAALARYLGSC